MKISGHVDLCGPELIEGWLHCDAWEDEPIKLQVFVSGDSLGECVVDRFRNDLQDAGYGDGRCGFSFFVPEGFASANFAETRLRLVGTPVFLLPDEFSHVAQPAAGAPGGLSGLEKSANFLGPQRRGLGDSDDSNQAGKARPPGRTLHHTP